MSADPDWAPSRTMLLRAVSWTAVTTGVCRALTDRLAALGPDPARLHVVEHGVDVALIGPVGLSVGHLIDRKGHDFAIRAIAGLPILPC